MFNLDNSWRCGAFGTCVTMCLRLIVGCCHESHVALLSASACLLDVQRLWSSLVPPGQMLLLLPHTHRTQTPPLLLRYRVGRFKPFVSSGDRFVLLQLLLRLLLLWITSLVLSFVFPLMLKITLNSSHWSCQHANIQPVSPCHLSMPYVHLPVSLVSAHIQWQ